MYSPGLRSQLCLGDLNQHFLNLPAHHTVGYSRVKVESSFFPLVEDDLVDMGYRNIHWRPESKSKNECATITVVRELVGFWIPGFQFLLQ